MPIPFISNFGLLYAAAALILAISWRLSARLSLKCRRTDSRHLPVLQFWPTWSPALANCFSDGLTQCAQGLGARPGHSQGCNRENAGAAYDQFPAAGWHDRAPYHAHYERHASVLACCRRFLALSDVARGDVPTPRACIRRCGWS